ncbi:MAG TPA: hypothetical protein VIK86_02110 [Candidatus Paceibacterota bacterium]
MNTHLLDYKLKELFMLSKKNKLYAIKLLIDSISDDAVYDNNAERETELEQSVRRIVKSNVASSTRADNKIT